MLFCFWEWKGAKLPIVPSMSWNFFDVKILRYRDIVYIFKHITVTGVYITMFVKCVGFYNFNYDAVLTCPSPVALSFIHRCSTFLNSFKSHWDIHLYGLVYFCCRC